ncbi:Putative glycosyltransferase EpsE [Anaerolineales bacterium]|nr:Putative glycosyltransferase EpsE [Anaerolineales bacterium]
MISQANHAAAPRVSVLMTIYNAGPYLRAAIDSLIAQTFPDWELIAVENGSADQSKSALKSYSDPRVRVFPLEKNIGRTPALRLAFEQARGEYIAILDADDISAPDRFAQQVAFLDQHPDVALVASWAQLIDEHGKVFDVFEPPANQKELQDCLGWTNPLVHSSVTYRRESAQQVGGYPDLVWAQDLGLTLALARRGKIAMIPAYLCQVRMLAASMTRSRKYQILIANELLLLFKQAADTLQLSARAHRLNRRALAIAEIKLGIATLRDDSFWKGLRMALHGLFTAPSALWGNGPVRRFFGAKF